MKFDKLKCKILGWSLLLDDRVGLRSNLHRLGNRSNWTDLDPKEMDQNWFTLSAPRGWLGCLHNSHEKKVQREILIQLWQQEAVVFETGLKCPYVH